MVGCQTAKAADTVPLLCRPYALFGPRLLLLLLLLPLVALDALLSSSSFQSWLVILSFFSPFISLQAAVSIVFSAVFVEERTLSRCSLYLVAERLGQSC